MAAVVAEAQVPSPANLPAARSVDTACSPKWQALRTFLLDFHARAAAKLATQQGAGTAAAAAGGGSPRFHGIVFARERAAVMALVQLARGCPHLGFLEARPSPAQGGVGGCPAGRAWQASPGRSLYPPAPPPAHARRPRR